MNKDITFNTDAILLKLGIMELSKNCVLVISKGMAKVRELPKHGKYQIVTHQGRLSGCGVRKGKSFD